MVKKKMHLMKLLLLVVLIFGWLFAVMLATAESDEEKQLKEVRQAEQYYADKLYMRAVNTYQSAIEQYDTSYNAEIEGRILSIYQETGKQEEYLALVEERIEQGRAAQQEYIDLSDWYLKSGSEKQAIPILKEGMELFGEASFVETYNSVAFATSELTTQMSELSIQGDDRNIPYPAQDGKWGYLTPKARELLPAVYEEAFPFQGGYAVVKTEGKYVLIDTLGDWYAVDKTGIEQVTGYAGKYLVAVKGGKYALYTYTFSPVTDFIYEDAVISDNGLCFVKQDGKWGAVNGGGAVVMEFLYDEVVLNSRNQVFAGGYAVVKDAGGYLVINSSGEPMSDARYVNAKGAEGSLIAVADESGKWGFANGTKELVIPCQYSDAQSFSGALAPVCYGGEWGYITKSNVMVIEPSYEQAAPFYKGSALVKQNGICQILTLAYNDLL